MTADDATAGPSSAPLIPSVGDKQPSPSKGAGPRDKENTPDAVSNIGGAVTAPHSGGHTRTPSGHDAMTRDMGNLQMTPTTRHESVTLFLSSHRAVHCKPKPSVHAAYHKHHTGAV